MEAQGWGRLEERAGLLYLDWGAAMPRSDERGLCLLPWPAGVPFGLLAGGPVQDMGWASRAELALAPGEERALTLKVPVGPDYLYLGVRRTQEGHWD